MAAPARTRRKGRTGGRASAPGQTSHESEAAPGDDALDEARRLFVSQVGQELNIVWANISRIGGQLLALLYFEDRPLSVDDAASLLGASRTHVFVSLRNLLELDVVTRRRVRGSKRDLYMLAAPYPDVVIRALMRRVRRILAAERNSMQRVLSLLRDSEAREQAAGCAARVDRLHRQYQRGADIIDMLVGEEVVIDLDLLLGTQMVEPETELGQELVHALRAGADED